MTSRELSKDLREKSHVEERYSHDIGEVVDEPPNQRSKLDTVRSEIRLKWGRGISWREERDSATGGDIIYGVQEGKTKKQRNHESK